MYATLRASRRRCAADARFGRCGHFSLSLVLVGTVLTHVRSRRERRLTPPTPRTPIRNAGHVLDGQDVAVLRHRVKRLLLDKQIGRTTTATRNVSNTNPKHSCKKRGGNSMVLGRSDGGAEGRGGGGLACALLVILSCGMGVWGVGRGLVSAGCSNGSLQRGYGTVRWCSVFGVPRGKECGLLVVVDVIVIDASGSITCGMPSEMNVLPYLWLRPVDQT